MNWIARHAVVIIPLAALLARGAAVGLLAGTGPILPDEVQYWHSAAGIASGDGLVDELGFRATRMPLFPALLAPFTRFEGGWTAALFLMALSSAAAVVCTGILAFRVLCGMCGTALCTRDARLVAGVAATLVALDPFLIFLARFALTENLFCTALLLWLAVGWPLTTAARTRPARWLACALCVSVCVCIRPSAVALLPVWSAWVVWGGARRGPALVGVVAVWLVLATALAPWVVRNHQVTGRWTVLTNRLGISLYDGLGPQATGASDLGAIKNSPEVRGLNEVEWNAHFLTRAWQTARANPGRVVELAAIKLGRTWRPWPVADGYSRASVRIAGGAWSGAIMLLALYGLCILPRNGHALCGLLFPVVVFTALHMIFVGSVRYRLPVMPLIEILAAYGVIMLWRRRRPAVPQQKEVT